MPLGQKPRCSSSPPGLRDLKGVVVPASGNHTQNKMIINKCVSGKVCERNSGYVASQPTGDTIDVTNEVVMEVLVVLGYFFFNPVVGE